MNDETMANINAAIRDGVTKNLKELVKEEVKNQVKLQVPLEVKRVTETQVPQEVKKALDEAEVKYVIAKQHQAAAAIPEEAYIDVDAARPREEKKRENKNDKGEKNDEGKHPEKEDEKKREDRRKRTIVERGWKQPSDWKMMKRGLNETEGTRNQALSFLKTKGLREEKKLVKAEAFPTVRDEATYVVTLAPGCEGLVSHLIEESRKEVKRARMTTGLAPVVRVYADLPPRERRRVSRFRKPPTEEPARRAAPGRDAQQKKVRGPWGGAPWSAWTGWPASYPAYAPPWPWPRDCHY